MEISIDEAGSFTFVNAPPNSWSVAAAFASPETEKRKYKKALSNLKRKEGVKYTDEIKLYQVSEENYFSFLHELSQLKSILFCVATDSHLNTKEEVRSHKQYTIDNIKENIPNMLYQGGKDGLELLANQFSNTSEQLYVQLLCQVRLMHSFVYNGINYFVQRQPKTLSSFKWRVDNKEPTQKTDYEDAFEKHCPGLLQTYSISDPMPAFRWCDYSAMDEYIYPAGSIPEYLVERFPDLENESGFDIQKIVRKDIKFLDSKEHNGIQVADLLASGLRRLLKKGFTDNEKAAALLGSIMIMGIKGNSSKKHQISFEFVSFDTEKPIYLPNDLAKLIRIMERSCKPLMKK